MPAVSNVEQELRFATGVSPKEKESREDFLDRLADSVDRLSDPKWDKLTAPAQDWSVAASKALKNGRTIREFNSGLANRTTAAPPAPEKPAPKDDASVVHDDGPPMSGIKTEIKRLLLDDPRMSAEAIIDKLSKKGDPPSKFTVASIRADFRHSLKFLRQKGLIDIDL